MSVMGRGVAFAQDTAQPYYSIKHPRVLVMISSNADIAPAGLVLRRNQRQLPTTFIDDSKLIDRQTLSQFDVFVQFGPARITPDQEKALSDFVNNGGGFLALHNAIDGPREGAYEKLLGGSLVRTSDPYHINVHVTEEGRKNPLTAGVRDFENFRRATVCGLCRSYSESRQSSRLAAGQLPRRCSSKTKAQQRLRPRSEAGPRPDPAACADHRICHGQYS